MATLAALALAPAYADERHDIRIALGESRSISSEIVGAIRAAFPTATVANETDSLVPLGPSGVCIAIGPAGLRASLRRETDATIFSVFVSYQAFNALLAGAPATHRGQISGIFADPSPADQLRLISKIYHTPVRVGVLLSANNPQMASTLTRASEDASVPIQIESLGEHESIDRGLQRLSTRVILAVPDTAIFNSDTVRDVLLTTYRRNQAVVGFSTALVRAGALATVYSGIEEIVTQLQEQIGNFQRDGRVPSAAFPRYFRVSLNESVARSLDLVIDPSVHNFEVLPKGGAKP